MNDNQVQLTENIIMIQMKKQIVLSTKIEIITVSRTTNVTIVVQSFLMVKIRLMETTLGNATKESKIIFIKSFFELEH